MGLSRRQFTKEFKLAAVRRLEEGVSIAEVARGLEVNPNVLHRWRREFRQGPGNAFPGKGQRRWSEGRIAELERKIGQQTLETIFCRGACSASKSSGCCRHRVEIRRLRPGPGRNERRWWTDDSTKAGTGPGEPVQLLPLRSGAQAECGSRYGVAGCDSAYCPGVAVLRTARHHARVAPPKDGR